MGSVCCCFTVSDNATPDAANNFWGSNSFIQNLRNQYQALFGEGEAQGLHYANNYQDVALEDSEDMVLQENPRLSSAPVHQEIEIRKLEKGSSQLQMGGEADADFELIRKLISKNKEVVLDWGANGGKDYFPPKKGFPFGDVGLEHECLTLCSEDVDVCPTCLEEYTFENPKIITKCSHHYHLSCIYEWQERSESCPICGVVMEFEDTS